jgi:hypothetical protein
MKTVANVIDRLRFETALRLDRRETPDYCRVIDGALSKPEIGASEGRKPEMSGKCGLSERTS